VNRLHRVITLITSLFEVAQSGNNSSAHDGNTARVRYLTIPHPYRLKTKVLGLQQTFLANLKQFFLPDFDPLLRGKLAEADLLNDGGHLVINLKEVRHLRFTI